MCIQITNIKCGNTNNPMLTGAFKFIHRQVILTMHSLWPSVILTYRVWNAFQQGLHFESTQQSFQDCFQSFLKNLYWDFSKNTLQDFSGNFFRILLGIASRISSTTPRGFLRELLMGSLQELFPEFLQKLFPGLLQGSFQNSLRNSFLDPTGITLEVHFGILPDVPNRNPPGAH